MEKHERNGAVPIWLYIIGLGLLVYLFLYTYQIVGGFLGDVLIGMVMQLATIGLHEGSHMVMMAVNAPFIVIAAAGTVGQVGFVVLCLAVALWRKAYFVAAYMGLWLAYSFRQTGIYMKDALLQELPLVTPVPVADNSQVIHDWNYMFTHWGLMAKYNVIGNVVLAVGFAIGVMAICLGGLAIWRLYQHRKP